jgi:hypothetical protein
MNFLLLLAYCYLRVNQTTSHTRTLHCVFEELTEETANCVSFHLNMCRFLSSIKIYNKFIIIKILPDFNLHSLLWFRI